MWVLEWLGNWAEEGGGVWLDWGPRGRVTGLETDSGCPGLGAGGAGPGRHCVYLHVHVLPLVSHASSVTLLLHFIQVRRGALSFAPGANCVVCLCLLNPLSTYLCIR